MASLRRGLLLVPLAAAVLLGCGDTEKQAGRVLRADEVRGSVGGVGIGDDKASVRRRFGAFAQPVEAYPIEPLEISQVDGSGSPWSVVTGPHHLGPGGLNGEQLTLRFRGVAFFVRDDRVFGFLVTDRGGQTTRGVSIGDDLVDVTANYPNFDCDDEIRGETTAVFKANCSGKIRDDRYLYFGGDPIESITVTEGSVRSYAY